MNMSINFTPLNEIDIDNLINPMTRAFDNDSVLYNGIEKGGPPGYNDGSFLYKWAIKDEKSIAYKIEVEQEIIGAFIIWWNKNGESILGTIFLHPEYHNQKIGREAWVFIEKKFPTRSWRLRTPSWAIRNHHFYEAVCGFTKTDTIDNEIVYRKYTGS